VNVYAVKVFGWMLIIDAENKREATRIAKSLASSASLRRSDVNESHVRRATPDDIAWYRGMGGSSAGGLAQGDTKQ
jgi:hypothetical protein